MEHKVLGWLASTNSFYIKRRFKTQSQSAKLPKRSRRVMDEVLTRETFDPHVGKTFRVGNSHHALMLVRIETRQIEPWEKEAGLRAPFILIFREPAGDILAEGMHVLALEDGTSFDLYVIPIHTPVRTQQDYQSAFN
jgi:hypothetical protein